MLPGHTKAAQHTVLRDLKADTIGRLTTIQGVVVRIGKVAPLVQMVSYVCQSCGFEVFQAVHSEHFTPMSTCPSTECTCNTAKGELIMNHKASKYIDFQEVRIQEPTEDVPHGSVPRHLSITLLGHLTNACAPGDVVVVKGVFLPRPLQSAHTIGSTLLHDTYFEAFDVTPIRKSTLDGMSIEQKMNELSVIPKDEL